MQHYGIGDKEMALARLLWEREGIGSGEVVRLCAEVFDWKKSTTYTMLRRLCDHGLFQNVNSIVTSIMSEEEYKVGVGQAMIDDKFGGSLPMFVEAVIKRNGLNEEGRRELLAILNEE